MSSLEDILDPNTLLGQVDGSANLPRNIHSNAYATAIVVTKGPALLYGFTVYSSAAAAQFVQVFDASSVPADGAIPAVVFSVPTASDKSVQWLPARTFLTGIVICNSSTGPTKTIGAADCYFDVQFL